jgi:sigma-B regulation protein RsbU (phosphoserine phosphatase)
MGDGSTFVPLKVEPELVLGVDPLTEYRTETFDLPPGSSLVMYTDGVLDVMNPAGNRFGKDGLRKTLHGHFDSAQAIIDHLVSDLDQFRARMELPDDLTLVALQLMPTPVRRPAAVVAH